MPLIRRIFFPFLLRVSKPGLAIRRRSPPTVCFHVALRAQIGPLDNTPPIFSRSYCRICNRASGSVAAYPPNRRPRWIFESAARRRLKGQSSYRNRLASMSVLCMASLVAINGDRMLTGIAQRSAWLLPATSVFRPSNVFLPDLPSCGSLCRQSPVNPFCPLGFRRRCAGTSRIAVIAPKASGFNIQAPLVLA